MKYIGNEQLKELVRLLMSTLRRLAGLHAAITTTYLLIVHTQIFKVIMLQNANKIKVGNEFYKTNCWF